MSNPLCHVFIKLSYYGITYPQKFLHKSEKIFHFQLPLSNNFLQSAVNSKLQNLGLKIFKWKMLLSSTLQVLLCSLIKKLKTRTSLEVQWLRLHLQGRQV